jgi:glycerate kinase
LARAERCLRQLAKVSREYFRGIDYSARPGSGAAGGLGFGLAAFAAAKLEPGFELLCQNAKLDDKLKKADLVITGEGAIDASSLMGKGAGQLAGKCRQLKIPCIGLAGHVEAGGGRVLNKTFTHLYSLDSITSPEKARSQAAFWLRHLAEQAARELH